MSVLGFELEWYDPVSGLLTPFYLKYFLDDNTIEILTAKSTFLKKIYYPDVTVSDLFIGNTITVYNRLLVVKKFANSATTAFMNAREVRFLCIVGKNELKQFGKLMLAAKNCGLVMGKIITMSADYNSDSICANKGDVAVEVVGILAAKKDKFLTSLNTPSMSEVRAVQVTTEVVADFFQNGRKTGFIGQCCSLCVAKPHLIQSQEIGELVTAISDAGFNIHAIFAVHLTLPMAEEFLEVYRGVLGSYTATVEHMCVTPVLAIMIAGSGDVVEQFREFTGPVDPKLAKVVRPESLRARFGKDLVHNAVHCTDLPEDGEMECRYFFETLAGL